jgi:hypothetical protein
MDFGNAESVTPWLSRTRAGEKPGVAPKKYAFPQDGHQYSMIKSLVPSLLESKCYWARKGP